MSECGFCSYHSLHYQEKKFQWRFHMHSRVCASTEEFFQNIPFLQTQAKNSNPRAASPESWAERKKYEVWRKRRSGEREGLEKEKVYQHWQSLSGGLFQPYNIYSILVGKSNNFVKICIKRTWKLQRMRVYPRNNKLCIIINPKGCGKEVTNPTLSFGRATGSPGKWSALAWRRKSGNCWGNGGFWQLWGGGWRNLFSLGLTRSFNVWATSPRDVMGIRGNKTGPQEGHSGFVSFCGKIKTPSKDHPTLAFQLSHPPGLSECSKMCPSNSFLPRINKDF